jgi:hypothetical protein
MCGNLGKSVGLKIIIFVKLYPDPADYEPVVSEENVILSSC